MQQASAAAIISLASGLRHRKAVMKFNIRASFGGADEIYRSKPQLVGDMEAVLHSLNMPVGYKITGRLPKEIQAAFKQRDNQWDDKAPSELKLRTALGPRTSAKSVDLRHTGLKVDIEIERGNVGSVYRDVFKFNIHHNAGIIDLGIIITPNREMSLALGEDIAWSGRVEDELRISWQVEANSDCPVLLIELVPERHPDGESLLDEKAKVRLRELQMTRGKGRDSYPQWRG